MPRFPNWLSCPAIALLVGCASWSPSNEGDKRELPVPRMSPDSVVVEITFVEIPEGEDNAYDEVWNEVDEQSLPLDIRRRLAANGMRCGHIGSQLPARLREQLNRGLEAEDLLAGDFRALDNSLSARHEQRQMRSGQAGKIVATKQPRQRMHVLVNKDGQVAGQSYEQAQCVFRIRAFPKGDSRARLELTPEIHHGEMKQKWVGYEGALRLDADRERQTFEDLTLESVLAPGEVLIVGGTAEAMGLGGQFFAPSEHGNRGRQCLLIRLAQTQIDDLFAPVQEAAPIVTPAE